MVKVLLVNFNITTKGKLFEAAGLNNRANISMVGMDELFIIDDRIFTPTAEVEDYDFVLIGPVGKNSTIALFLSGYLLRKSIPSLSYGCPMHISNKINELDRLIQKDIPHIQTVVAKHINMRLSSEIESWGYPIVTKPFNGAKGKDVIRHDVEGSVATIFTNNEDFVLVQPFIPNDGDYRVFVMNKKILGCMKRTPPENDFRANVSIGGRAIAYEMTQDMIDLSQKVIEAFPEDFLGIDLIRHQQTGELYVMEVNHAPQFQGFMQATGIDMYDLMIKECVSLVR